MTLQDLYDKTNFLDICDEHIMLDDVGMVKLTTYTRYNNPAPEPSAKRPGS